MRPYLFRRFLSLAGLAGLAAGTLTTATAAAVPWAPGAAAARGAGVPAAGSQPVLLINGTRLLPRAVPGGGTAVAVLPESLPTPRRGFSALITMSAGGHAMDIAADALPFVGHGLDPGLFDVSALQRAERSGRLPVRVSYHGRV